ncbi:hypothetical protein FRC19_007825 [Serendipita sp. 401]|nr:hypothetical protein FRC19_007825 [Serendipita sp. 401]
MQRLPLNVTKSSIITNNVRISSGIIRRTLRTSACVRSTPLKQPTVDHGYLPNSSSPITTSLEFFDSVTHKSIPAYRVLDGNGEVLEGATVPEIDETFARKLYLPFAPLTAPILKLSLDTRRCLSAPSWTMSSIMYRDKGKYHSIEQISDYFLA